MWVKKFITKKEYDEYYKYQESYSILERKRGGYIVGFLIIGNEVPINHWKCEIDDLKKIKKDREEGNIYPIPEV